VTRILVVDDNPTVRRYLRGVLEEHDDWRVCDEARNGQEAVERFRLAAAGAGDATQVHTHMCYSEFNDFIGAIAAMDADVISIETARSKMELLDAFREGAYVAGIGPGVYDIHSPRVPSIDEMADLLAAAQTRLSPEQLWVNPDCGLKTRGWPETEAALRNMVAAARQAREAYQSAGARR